MALTVAEIREFVARLAVPVKGEDSAGLVDRLDGLERLKAAAGGAQLIASVEVADRELARDAAAGVPLRRRGEAAGALVGFACRISPWAGTRRIAEGRVLVEDLPRTLSALRRGEISQWRATIVARASAALDAAARRRVDAELAAELPKLGDRKLKAAASAAAYQADPEGFVARRAKAEADRRVTVRPAPDTMAYLTALLPVEQAVAVYAALDRYAKTLIAAGDARARDQIMADTAYERLTGQVVADGVAVEIGLILDAETLFAGGTAPATIRGYGAIPASLARTLATGGARRTGAQRRRSRAWLRRLFCRRDGQLVAMDSRRRGFDDGIRELIAIRDHDTCRTPFCDAPLRHADHAVPRHDGGPTRVGNGQGLCEACNYRKEHPGWRTTVIDDGSKPWQPHRVRTVLPTGHAYDSTAPPITPETSRVERHLRIDLAFRSPPDQRAS